MKAGPGAGPSALTGAPAENEPAPADDDPFAVDQSATANAIPVSRQQGPGKTLAVTCPMCETHGFVSPKAAGKLVKCCNPQCMVPVFSAPVIKKEEPVAPPPPKKKLPWMYILGGITAAGIAAVCIYVMNHSGPIELPPVTPTNLTGKSDGAGPEIADHARPGEQNGNKTRSNADAADGDSRENSSDHVRKEALKRLSDMAQRMRDREKSQYRRLAAVAAIAVGDAKQTTTHLGIIEKAGSAAPYEALPPRVALAWQKAAGPEDEFEKEVRRVQHLAEKLPHRGRFATEASVVTAPLLVVTGKSAEARKLLSDHRSDEKPVEQLAAAIQIVMDDQTFNLDVTLPGRTVGDWEAPLDAAVVLILTHHGRWDDAIAWATQSADPVVKAELTSLWAESYVRHAVPADDVPGFERAKKEGQGLSPEGRARLLARLAAVKFSAGDRPAAEDLIEQATKAVAAIEPAKPVMVEGAKPLLDLKLPDPTPYLQAARAATEIAGVQAQLGQPAEAWASILLGLKLLQGIAPSKSSMEERERQLQQQPNKVRDELTRVMGLKKDQDEIRRVVSQYNAKFRDVAAATDVRFFWQGVVLEAAADFGLLDQVWELTQELDRKQSIDERDPLLRTGLPLVVAARFAAAGNQKKVEEIRAAVRKRTVAEDPQVVKLNCEKLFTAGDHAACIEQLNDAMKSANESMKSSAVLQEWTLRLACRLIVAGKSPEAVSFCRSIRDPALRENGLFLTAALAARLGHAAEYWTETSNLEGVESAAACSGLVVGLQHAPIH